MLAIGALFAQAQSSQTCDRSEPTVTALTLDQQLQGPSGGAHGCPRNSPDSACKQCWQDYSVVADDDNYNLVFQVNATSDYANAIGIYLSSSEFGLPPLAERSEPSQFLDFDATSMIVIDGIRQYSIALSQCYIRRGATYYLSVFGKNVVGTKDKPAVPYTIAVKKVPSAIPMNSTVFGQVCDGQYMHYYWDIDTSFTSGGIRTFVSKTEGDLDSAFVRYERCAGLAGANLATVKLEGHGTPSGSIVLPQNSQPMEAGRYYVSVKGKPEICGDYRIHVDTLTQVQLLASPAASLRSGGFISLLASLVPAWLLGRAFR